MFATSQATTAGVYLSDGVQTFIPDPSAADLGAPDLDSVPVIPTSSFVAVFAISVRFDFFRTFLLGNKAISIAYVALEMSFWLVFKSHSCFEAVSRSKCLKILSGRRNSVSAFFEKTAQLEE